MELTAMLSQLNLNRYWAKKHIWNHYHVAYGAFMKWCARKLIGPHFLASSLK
jgi:hypothetical protein